MKSSLVLLALVAAAPSLAVAQTQTAPVRVAASPEPMPKAQELLDDLFAPYAAAKTFSGKLNISAEDASLKTQLGFSEMQLETRYRYNSKGDLQNDDTTITFGSSSQRSELRFIRGGATNVAFFPDKKVWWKESKDLGSQPSYPSLMSALTGKVSSVIEEGNIKPVISRGVEAGLPVFIVKAKLGNGFRVVVDQQTRALRSFELRDGFSIRCFEQTFDKPMTDESFEWTPPTDYKQIQESESLAFYPDFLRALREKTGTAKTSPTMSDAATPTG